MGYTTEFRGSFEFVAAANPKGDVENYERVIRDIQDFCIGDFRQSYTALTEAYGIHTRWCDWVVNFNETPDGSVATLAWSGSEKSYCMYEWLHLINDTFLIPNGLTLQGRVVAQGEMPDDKWAMEFQNGRPRKMRPVTAWYVDNDDVMYDGDRYVKQDVKVAS